MNELDQLKKPKRILKNITFQHENAALSYTTQGAASLKNKAYLFKSLDTVEKELSEGVSTSEGDNTCVNHEVSKSNDNLKQEKGDQMSDQNLELVTLQKQVKAMTIEKSLTKYALGAEMEATLAGAMADLEDTAAIFKALDALQDAGKVALDKALAEKETKAEEGKTELQKMLDKEEGHQDVVAPVAKSLVQQACDSIDEKEAK